jgi:prophage antirepressor-like protein
MSSLDDDEKGVAITDTPGGPQQTAIINESGLYSLILRSRKRQAKAFKRWITHDVIPSIRKTGSYGLRTLPSNRELALMVVAEADRADAAEAKIRELEPSACAWDVLAAEAVGDYSVREAAQVLNRDPWISTGQNRLFASLRDLGWIDSSGQPYQAQVDNGRLVRRTTSYTHPHSGEPVLSSQVRITPKGLAALRERLGGQQELISLGGTAA